MDDQTKKIIFKIGPLVAVAGIALLLFAALIYVRPQLAHDLANGLLNQSQAQPEEPAEEGCDDQCLYEKALANASWCDDIANQSLKEQCYKHWANESLDYCLKADAATREECVYYHAKKQNDISVCENAANKTACVIFVDECYAYEKEEEQGRCFAYKKGDYSYCQDDMCYFDFALMKKNKSICEMIASAARRLGCISIIEKTDHCGELGTKAERDLCWQIFAIESNDSSVCFKITKQSMYALECFSYYAAKLRDLSFCDAGNFVLDDLWACYANYSLGSGDLAGCDAIYNKSWGYASTNIYRCYSTYAKKYGDPSACNGIRDLAQMRTCYEGSILGARNINYLKCSDVQIETWRNKCYTEYAKYNNDSSVCYYIPTENERKTCYSAWRAYNNITAE